LDYQCKNGDQAIPWERLLADGSFSQRTVAKLHINKNDRDGKYVKTDSERNVRYLDSLRITEAELDILQSSIGDLTSLVNTELYHRITIDDLNDRIIAQAIAPRLTYADLQNLLSNDETISFAASCLYFRNEPIILPALMVLAEDEDPDIRYLAAKAFGSYCDSTSIKTLLMLINDDEPRTSHYASKSLAKYLTYLEYTERCRFSEEIVNLHAKFTIAKEFHNKGFPESDRLFMQIALASEDAGLTLASCYMLFNCDDPDIASSFFETASRIKTENYGLDTKIPILETLSSMPFSGSKEMIVGLAKLADTGDTKALKTVQKVAMALVLRKDEGVLPILVEYAQSADPYIRWCMAHALGNHKTELSISSLSKLVLESDEVFIRCAANDSLGVLRKTETIPLLLGLLQDPEFLVRASLVSALCNYGQEDILLQLFSLTEDCEPCVRSTLIRGLMKNSLIVNESCLTA